MANQYTNKVIFGSETLIDLTNDTVTASDVAEGVTFHLPSGEPSVGTATGGPGSIVIRDSQDIHGGTIREITAEVLELGSLSATQNQTYYAPSGHAYDEVVVNVSVAPTLQSKIKNYTPFETAQSENVTADNGYDGLSQVTVNVGAISSTYVGSGIPRKSAQTYTPTTTAQTITSNQYLTGVQTIGAIPSNYIIPEGSQTFTENGTYNVASLASAIVSVPTGGGGISIDDIAMRAISGSITGSASDIYSYAFFSCSLLTDASFPECSTVWNNAFESCAGLLNASFQNCIYIRSSAFANCSSLSTISFPICTNILANAFTSCISLKEAKFPNVVTMFSSAFQYCSSLSIADFPECTFIYDNAFAYCSGLTSVNFPKVSRINIAAFLNCRGLISINFPEVSSMQYMAFQGCSSLQTAIFSKLSSIPASAFQYDTSLQSLSFPSCMVIGEYAFYNCSGLVSIESNFFPEAKTIGSYAFYNCRGLISINFPKVETIYSYAFTNCSSLSVVSLPMLKTIRPIFGGCPISSINLPACTNIEANAFNGYSGLLNVSIPGATTIGSYAFNNCIGLTSINFPSCTSIGFSAFFDCSNISTISFPECLVIGSNAFQNCSNLDTASFPKCSIIYHSAFQNCIGLSSVNFSGGATIYGLAFDNCTNLKIGSFYNCSRVWSSAFINCTSLNTLIFDNLFSSSGTIYTYAFQSCYTLLSLYLLASYRYVLSATSAFASTPISTYTTYTDGVRGSIFVKESLYSAYISATNWATYSARIVSLTDAQVQNVITYGKHDP